MAYRMLEAGDQPLSPLSFRTDREILKREAQNRCLPLVEMTGNCEVWDTSTMVSASTEVFHNLAN